VKVDAGKDFYGNKNDNDNHNQPKKDGAPFIEPWHVFLGFGFELVLSDFQGVGAHHFVVFEPRVPAFYDQCITRKHSSHGVVRGADAQSLCDRCAAPTADRDSGTEGDSHRVFFVAIDAVDAQLLIGDLGLLMDEGC